MFDEWQAEYQKRNERFIRDGIVDHESWNDPKLKRRVLYVLKEVNDPQKEQDWTIRELLEKDHVYPMWVQLAEWTQGLLGTTGDYVPDYANLTNHKDAAKEILWKIATLNLKKSPGGGSANMEIVRDYARKEHERILQEIMDIDPDIIVCCGTGEVFWDEIYKQNKGKRSDQVGEHRHCIIQLPPKDKPCLLIDFWHPANHWPKLLNYYGIVNIYRHALKTAS